jgi:hypothetical protein
MSAWKEYKKKLGETRPWDILNPERPKANDELAQKRLDICLDCDRLINATKQCRECGCFMVLKTKLQNATCPLNKW